MALRDWPSGGDPRTPCFCCAGFNAGKPAPWQWLVTIADATGPAEGMNGVHLVPWDDDVDDDGAWCVWLLRWSVYEIRVDKKASGYGPPAPDSVTFLLTVKRTRGTPYEAGAGWSDEWPEPDVTWPGLRPGDDEEVFPTPVLVQAVAWDYQV